MRVGVVNKNGKRLVDRYSDESFFAMRAENEPDKIFFVIDEESDGART